MSIPQPLMGPPQTPADFRLCSQWAFLPKTIYFEAKGEPFEGKVAVGEVLVKRLRAEYRGAKTISGVALDPKQFSPYNGPQREPNPDDPVFLECCAAAALAVSGTTDFSKGALHFLNPDIANPSWYDPAKVVARIGGHAFLVDVDSPRSSRRPSAMTD